MGRKKKKAPKGKSLVTQEQLDRSNELTRQAVTAREQEVELLRQQTEQQQIAFQRQLVLQEEQARALEQSRAEQQSQLQLIAQQQQAQQEAVEQRTEAQEASTTQQQSRTARTGNRLQGLVQGQRGARQSRQRSTRRTIGPGGRSAFRMF